MRTAVVIGLVAALGVVATGQTHRAGPQSRPSEDVLAGRVVDHEGVPVSRGSVRIVLRTPYDQPVYATAASFDRRVALDSEGRFAVAVPRHGKYRVLAEADGLAVASRDWVSPGDSVELVAGVPATLRGRVVRGDTGDPVEGATLKLFITGSEHQPLREQTTSKLGEYSFAGLPAGGASLSTWVEGLVGQWNDLTLEPGAVKAHEVRLEKGFRVTGRVVDAESGRPLGGARVGGPQRTVTTDAAGVFTMGGLEPRTYEFQASAKGWIPGRVTVGVDQHRVPAEIAFSLEKGEVVHGSVVDPNGQAIQGVLVDSKADQALTDAAGRFEVVVRVGQGGVFTITRAGYSPKMLLRSHPAFTASHQIVLEPADVTIAGRVRDSDGRPLADVRVQCRATTHGGETFDRVVASDAGGAFEISGCPRWSSFEVIALAPGFCENVAKVAQRFEAAARVEVDLTLGAQASVAGTVVDAAHAPVPGACVVLRAHGARYAITQTAPVSADEKGRFEIRSPFGSDTGIVVLVVSAAGFVTRTIEVKPGRADPIDPVVLVRCGRIRGQLVDASTRAPITHARLRLCRGEVPPDLKWNLIENVFGMTEEAADFDFEAPPGRYWLIPEAPGFTTEHRAVGVSAGVASNVGTIALHAGGTVEGTIRAASGAPVTAIVSLRMLGEGSVIRAAETDGAGRFRGDGIPPGTYEAFAIKTDPGAIHRGPSPTLEHPWPLGRIEVSLSVPAKLDVELPRPARLTLVLAGDLEPPREDGFTSWWPGCPPTFYSSHITVTALDGTPLSQCATAAPGFSSSFVMSAWELSRMTVSLEVPASRCSVAVVAAGFDPITTVAVMTSGSETRVELALKRVAPESRPR